MGLETQQLQIYNALYDALNDDDLEIREKAASIASCVLSHYSQASSTETVTSLSPPAATDQLLKRLSLDFENAPPLQIIGLGRMIGMPPALQVGMMNLARDQQEAFYSSLTPFSEELNVVTEQGTSLFVEEKQNLYKDDAQESQRWCSLLCGLPASTVSAFDLSPLFQWILDGLKALLSSLKKESGGPLTWASKLEAFCLGIRLFCVAEVGLVWSLKLEAPTLHQEISNLLRTFETDDVQEHLHPLWRRRIAGLKLA